MRLAFLLERRYVPYAKWFGTAFQRLRCFADLSPHLLGALAATGWQSRERQLAHAYEVVTPVLRGLPPRIGSVNQWVDATDVPEAVAIHRSVRDPLPCFEAANRVDCAREDRPHVEYVRGNMSLDASLADARRARDDSIGCLWRYSRTYNHAPVRELRA
ncbi:MAG: hypothetical protein JO020_03275 [Chloroflexi bacterium]|nr:hypothetical protein [Chloroflexota bacterium]